MKRYWQAFASLILSLLLTPLSASAADASETTWPREFTVPEGVVVIYQPQPEKLEGDQLYARAAVALEIKGNSEPIFGAIWFNSQLNTDRAERTATFQNVDITRVRFPDEDKTKAQQLTTLLETELPKRQLSIDMDNLIATLEYAEERSLAAQKLNTAPPKVLFVDEPAVLISIDGEPHFQEEDGIKRVINTPFTIVQDPADQRWYLNADADSWYSANEIAGQWQLVATVPSNIAALAPPSGAAEQENDKEAEDDQPPGPAPKVIVVTEPSELISSTGKPEFTPIQGTDLLYVSNTDSDVMMDISKQEYYILLSGRWYASKSLEGPWSYIPGDELPKDFPNIPQDSEVANVRYAVPGTEEAEEAVLDAQMPQTAAVDRKQASLTTEYDGDPQFTEIKGTKLSYAINTATPVIAFGGRYYALDEAVWFVAEKPQGAWAVATKIPADIYTIPPESPLYYVTFVRIYSYTPEVVYVGYTQGYTNVYIYHGTIVYGTGYWYPGWYGRYYYPRPSTWGFHVRYNPRRGWNFGLSYSNGPFTFSIGRGGWYRGGWWGPSRYRGYRHGYRHGRRAGYRAGYNAGRRNASRQNIYRSQRNQSRTRNNINQHQQRNPSRAASNRANNVYADRNGNVHRNTNNGWEQKTKQGWNSDTARSQSQARQSGQKQRAAQSQQRPTNTGQRYTSNRSSQSTQQQLNRNHQARQRGNQRSQQQRSGGRGRR
ncbi:MAG: hypothetical protein V7752_11625 [Halopseudomonas sp.]